MKGYIIDPAYKVTNNKAYVTLFGRLENGKSFVTINEAKPYFYIKTKDIAKAKKIAKFQEEESKKTTFAKEPVTKIILTVPAEVPEIRDDFHEADIATYEADIRFAYRYLHDRDIGTTINIEGDYEGTEKIDCVFKEPEITQAEEYKPLLIITAIDIETAPNNKKIYSIAATTNNTTTAWIVSKEKAQGAIHCLDEETLIEKFTEYIQEEDPDIITGWNVIDFDLDIIKNSAKKHKISLSLGRTNAQLKIRKAKSFFQASKADVPGRMILDTMQLLRDSFIDLPDYKLETAAEKLLGEKKSVQFTNKIEEITRMYEKDKEKLIQYNKKDTELVIQILKKTTVFDLAIKRSQLTGLPLDRISASIASLDSIYIKKAIKRNYVLPTTKYVSKEQGITGGYVQDPVTGIHEYVNVLDFKSLYPSLIRTFNIDPLVHQPDGKGKSLIKAPNNTYFRNDEEGILPEIIATILKEREKAKKEKDNVKSYALKILMNSFFGVMASPACRFFNMELANAITHFGQKTIKETVDYIEKQGYKVLYADTDSTFVLTKAKDEKGAEKIGKRLIEDINIYWKKTIKKEYNRESHLELEFEKCFIKLILPKLRHKEQGAKKRYAGLIKKDGKEEIDITGLETVRSDWTEAAKQYQLEVLNRIFHNKEVTEYTKKFIKDIYAGKYDDKLIYRKQLRKDESEYKRTTPPHVKAARKLKKQEGKIIYYIITKDGPEPIQNQKHNIDYNHYVNKQIKPIADAILVFFNTSFDELTGEQKTLAGFS